MGHELQPIQMSGPAYHKCPIQTRYILHSTVLESVPSAKYLGITISDNLSWTPHIDSVSKEANQTLGFLKRNTKVHNKDLESTAYTTSVRPQLEYASTVLHLYTEPRPMSSTEVKCTGKKKETDKVGI